MLKHLAILALAFAGFYSLARGVAWYGPYIYDQADYMYAASQGWQANAFDSPSMPLGGFFKAGLSRGRDPAEQTDLSSEIRASDDVLFYRHWHGPLYGYWLAIMRKFTVDERATRKLNYLFAVTAAVLLYFGGMWLLDGTVGQISGVLAAVLYLWSYAAIKSSELAPHQLFTLLSAAVLLLLAKMLQSTDGARRYWYAAVVVSALAFCTLEVAFALISVLVICGWTARGVLKPDVGLVVRSCGAFAATVLLMWPAALLKLSPVKSYAFMAYLALFRNAAWGDDASFAETWRMRFSNSPVPWILFAVGAVYVVKNRRAAGARLLIPFAAFSAIMFLATSRVTTTASRYELPLLPGIVLLGAFATALAMAQWSPVRRYLAVSAICAAVFLTSWRSVRSELPDPVQQTDTVLALIRANQNLVTQSNGTQKPVLVPHEHLPMVHYYFPAMPFRSYYDEREMADQISSGEVAGVIMRTSPPRFVPVQ